MADTLYLLGSGGHGLVVLDALLASGIQVAGILDPLLKIGSRLFGVPVLGGDDFLDESVSENVALINGLGANPYLCARIRLYEKMKENDLTFRAVQHYSSVIGHECRIDEGSQVLAGVVIQNRVHVGENAVINTRASVDHDCSVGAHGFISPGAILCGKVEIGTSAFIGAGAVVLPGRIIGEKAIIGAGTIVTKDIPNGWIVVGNPAKPIGMNT